MRGTAVCQTAIHSLDRLLSSIQFQIVGCGVRQRASLGKKVKDVIGFDRFDRVGHQAKSRYGYNLISLKGDHKNKQTNIEFEYKTQWFLLILLFKF